MNTVNEKKRRYRRICQKIHKMILDDCEMKLNAIANSKVSGDFPNNQFTVFAPIYFHIHVFSGSGPIVFSLFHPVLRPQDNGY